MESVYRWCERVARQICLAPALTLICALLPAAASAETPRTVRVGVGAHFQPYAQADAQGNAAGFGVDLFRAVAGAAGLNAEIAANDWNRIWQGLLSGQYDASAIVSRIPEREGQVEFSRPHTFGYDSFFVRRGRPPVRSIEQARGLSVIVMKADAAYHALVSRGFDRQLVLVDAWTDGLRLLASGQHDALLAPALQGNLQLRSLGLEEAIESGPLLKEYRREFCFVARKGDTQLIADLERGLAIVQANGEYDRLYRRWLKIHEPSTFPKRYVAWGSAGFVTALSLLFLWAWTLRRQVATRTAELVAAHQTVSSSLAEIEDLYQHPPCGYHSLDRHGNFLRINDTALRLLGYQREEIVGIKRAQDLLSPESRMLFEQYFPRLVATGEDVPWSEVEFVRKDGSSMPAMLSASSVRDADGQFVMSRTTFYDISERRTAEELQKRLNRTLRLLTDCSLLVLRSANEQDLLDAICRLVVDQGGYRMAWVGFAENDPHKTVRAASHFGQENGYLESAQISWGAGAGAQGPTGTAIRTGKTQVNQDFRNNPATIRWRDAALARGYESSIALPLVDKERIFGALTIYSGVAQSFGSQEVELLEELAHSVSLGVSMQRSEAARNQAEHELRQSEERIRSLFTGIRDAVVVYGFAEDGQTEGLFLEANEYACALLGYRRDQLLQLRPSDLVVDGNRFERPENDSHVVFERLLGTRSGRRITVEIGLSAFTLGGKTTFIALMRDIGERKRAELALRESEQRLKNAQRIARLGDWVLDLPTRRFQWSEQMSAIFGRSATQPPPEYADFFALVHAEDRDWVKRRWDLAITKLRPLVLEFRLCDSIAKERVLHVEGEVNEDTENGIRLVGTALDISQSKLIERQLKESREQLRRLSAHHERIIEEERRHIAREVHDELGQLMTGLKLEIAMLRRELPGDSATQSLGEMQQIVERAIKAVRTISSNLRPVALDLGLLAALEWLARDVSRHGVNCEIRQRSQDVDLHDGKATAVFRVAQESLTNVLRHASAKNVVISVAARNGSVHVLMCDDGKGFDLKAAARTGHLGLLGIRERIRMEGGSLWIRSVPGRGTAVRIRVPQDTQGSIQK